MKKDYTKLFQNLNKSRNGQLFVEYLEELLDSVCDIRQHPEISNETRNAVASLLQSEIIDMIKVVQQPKEGKENNEFV